MTVLTRLLATVTATLATHGCTPKQFEHAADITYQGTRLPRKGAYGHLWALVTCLEAHGTPGARGRALRAWRVAHDAWALRRHPPMSSAVASWYDDSGSTGCGFHTTYGIAALNIPCGARVELCHAGCVTATRDDSGPFVAGRLFDLNPTVRNAIGCPDLCNVTWRMIR